MAIISFLTAFYIIRIALVVAKNNKLEKAPVSKTEFLAIFGLLLLNILFYIYLRLQVEYKIAEPFWAALTAWIVVYILYNREAFWKVPLLYPLSFNGFYLDKFYNTFCVRIYEIFSNFLYWIDKNVFGNYKLLILSAKSGVKVADFVENKIMDGSVRFLTDACRKLSVADKIAQSGNVQRYNAYAFIIITSILTSLIFAYAVIITYLGNKI